MNYPLVVAASLGATVFFAASTVLKHHSATGLPATAGGPAARMGRFVAATLSHRWFLAGVVADAGGLGLQALALHLGAVSVVQPLLVTALLTSLLLSHLSSRTPVTGEEVRWGAVLVVSLAGFLVVSGASSAGLHPQAADRLPAAIAAAVAVVLGGALVAASGRVSGGRRAVLLGLTVGAIYAFTAVLIKAVTQVLSVHGLWAAVTSWQLLALVVCGAAGLLLAQLAFRAGPLSTSLPVIATVDPILSVVLGVVIYDERLRTGALALTAEALLLVALALSAVKLTRLELRSA